MVLTLQCASQSCGRLVKTQTAKERIKISIKRSFEKTEKKREKGIKKDQLSSLNMYLYPVIRKKLSSLNHI